MRLAARGLRVEEGSWAVARLPPIAEKEGSAEKKPICNL